MKGKMKFVFAGIFALLCFGEVMAGTLKDSRDGKSYKTVKIGQQIWMAENLNYNMDDSYCYGNKEANCKQYGRLYTWKSAMKACPSGWHLPSKAEFETLLASVEKNPKKLRARNWTDTIVSGGDYLHRFCIKYGCSYGTFGESVRECKGSKQCGCGNGNSICLEDEQRLVKIKKEISYNRGEDSFGFSVLPAGYYYGTESFSRLGSNADFWSSTEYHSGAAYELSISVRNAVIGYSNKTLGLSVRCLQDDEEYMAELDRVKFEQERQKAYDDSVAAAKDAKLQKIRETDGMLKVRRKTFKDPRDGQVYSTLEIDGKVWMVENLRYVYKKGLFDKGNGQTWCYKNDPSNCQKYGYLYNWDAAMKSCPKGWHLPTKDDFESLISFKPPFDKLASKSGWILKGRDESESLDSIYNAEGGLYEYGFDVLPAGYVEDKRSYLTFDGLGKETGFWSSTMIGYYERPFCLYFNGRSVSVHDKWFHMNDGFSVRCVEDLK